jgi:prepilin-type N-terminal cleavage/methylation domain-containing protein
MRRTAFTLLELVLVMAVIVALVAITYPSIEPMYRQHRMSAAADQLKAGLLHARAQAVEEGRPYVFAMVPGKGNFRVAPAGQQFWSGGAAPTEGENGNKPFLFEDALPRGVYLKESKTDADPEDEDTVLEPGTVGPEQYKQLVTFLPDGTADRDYELSLGKKGTASMVISLRGLTGIVTLRKAPASEGR